MLSTKSFVIGSCLLLLFAVQCCAFQITKILEQLPSQATHQEATTIKPAPLQAQTILSELSQAQTQQLPQDSEQQQDTYQQTMLPFSIAGIRPASIASLLNTVSDTGFSYFNVHDQCRSRTACDVGLMLYKKLNFLHNWIIRASVRTLVDQKNVYSVAWNNGMVGRNCTVIYPACSQSPIDSLLNFAMMAT